MSITPSYDDYISANKQPSGKLVRSENAPPSEKMDRQTLLKYVQSAPPKQSVHLGTLRSQSSKPLSEVPLEYIDRCVEGVAQVKPLLGSIGHQESARPLALSAALSGTQENVQIDRTQQVGSGSFSNVWTGVIQKPQKNKAVAIKEFKESYYERELHFIDQLMRKSPKGLLRIYGKLSLPQGKTHVVMKLCNRGSALQFFNEHVSDKRACYQKLLGMFKVLHDFHRSGFCHRDIHEGNFLSHQPKKGDQQEYLADFGHAGSLEKGERLPLYGRPLYLANSPRLFTDLYDDFKNSLDEQDYDQSADRYGKEIDHYQFGMLCFRVCLQESGPLLMGVNNPSQVALVRKLDDIQREMDQEIKLLRLTKREKAQRIKELYTEKMENYFHEEFPSIPRSLATVIIGLLDFPHPMPLEQAIARWEEAIHLFQEGHL